MSLEIPKEITLDYLTDNVCNGEWAEYVDNHYRDLLNQFEDEELVDACRALAYSLIHMIDGTDMSKESFETARHTIEICRVGFNSVSDYPDKDKITELTIRNSAGLGDLMCYMGVSMINSGRPIAAFGCFSTAEHYYTNTKALFEKTNPKYANEMSIAYEHCRAKEAELYLRLIPDIPLEHRALFSNIANSYLNHAINNLDEYGDADGVSYYCNLLPNCIDKCIRYPITTPEDIDEMNRNTITDDYVDWCQNKVFFLNIFNEVPNFSSKYAKDDVRMDLEERYQWLLDDILSTYDHCRRTFYRVAKDTLSFIDKERDDDVESIIDCFVRLYGILDKVAKLIYHLFCRDRNLEDLKFYTVASSLSSDPNPYLQSLFKICRDVFPDKFESSKGIYDPRNNIYGRIMKRGFIRNCIMHDTLKISNNINDTGHYYNVATVSPLDLAHCTQMMFYDVREVILNMQLAYEYRKTN